MNERTNILPVYTRRLAVKDAEAIFPNNRIEVRGVPRKVSAAHSELPSRPETITRAADTRANTECYERALTLRAAAQRKIQVALAEIDTNT